uniref:Uncharacterized protein n=1 Tax=Chenopodium quinoa TaxID=63459 RepID=A0A803MBS5_CHEQI
MPRSKRPNIGSGQAESSLRRPDKEPLDEPETQGLTSVMKMLTFQRNQSEAVKVDDTWLRTATEKNYYNVGKRFFRLPEDYALTLPESCNTVFDCLEGHIACPPNPRSKFDTFPKFATRAQKGRQRSKRDMTALSQSKSTGAIILPLRRGGGFGKSKRTNSASDREQSKKKKSTRAPGQQASQLKDSAAETREFVDLDEDDIGGHEKETHGADMSAPLPPFTEAEKVISVTREVPRVTPGLSGLVGPNVFVPTSVSDFIEVPHVKILEEVDDELLDFLIGNASEPWRPKLTVNRGESTVNSAVEVVHMYKHYQRQADKAEMVLKKADEERKAHKAEVDWYKVADHEAEDWGEEKWKAVENAYGDDRHLSPTSYEESYFSDPPGLTIVQNLDPRSLPDEEFDDAILATPPHKEVLEKESKAK